MAKYSGSSLEATELKLKTTPTGGVSGEHSPYYRRLLSAGYKGFIQGTLGGAGFYGFLGTAVGALLAIPACIVAGPVGLAVIPAMAGIGIVKGANTFGNIGTVAAISAESADLSEQRRYLLDRYYDLPDGPEGDKQAEIIKQELAGLQKTERKHPIFHWKTVAVCAVIGAIVGASLLFPPVAAALSGTALPHALEAITAAIGGHATMAALPAMGALLGAFSGATIGIDRHYVRKWFDGSEKLLHDKGHTTHAIDERTLQMERLREAAKIDNQTKLILERRKGLNTYDEPNLNQHHAATSEKMPIASLDAVPDTKVTSAHMQDRLADIQKAMQIPTV